MRRTYFMFNIAKLSVVCKLEFLPIIQLFSAIIMRQGDQLLHLKCWGSLIKRYFFRETVIKMKFWIYNYQICLTFEKLLNPGFSLLRALKSDWCQKGKVYFGRFRKGLHWRRELRWYTQGTHGTNQREHHNIHSMIFFLVLVGFS